MKKFGTKMLPNFPISRTVEVLPLIGKPTLLSTLMLLLSKIFGKQTKAIKLDLVEVSIVDLGFSGIARYEEICWRGQELGLQLLPWCSMIYSDAVTDPESNRLIFATDLTLVDMWLLSYDVLPKRFYDQGDRFVFEKPPSHNHG